MKELESPVKIIADTQLVAEINKEYTLKGSMYKHQDGRKLYAVDPNTMTAEEVHITSNAKIGLDKKVTSEHRAHYDPNKIYVWALNKYNAVRKVESDIKKFIERKIEIERHRNSLVKV